MLLLLLLKCVVNETYFWVIFKYIHAVTIEHFPGNKHDIYNQILKKYCQIYISMIHKGVLIVLYMI